MEARIKIAQTDVGKNYKPRPTPCGTCWRPTGPARCWRTTGNKTDFEAADKVIPTEAKPRPRLRRVAGLFALKAK